MDDFSKIGLPGDGRRLFSIVFNGIQVKATPIGALRELSHQSSVV